MARPRRSPIRARRRQLPKSTDKCSRRTAGGNLSFYAGCGHWGRLGIIEFGITDTPTATNRPSYIKFYNTPPGSADSRGDFYMANGQLLGLNVGAPSNPTVTLADVADQIDYVCQLTGSSRHAAIGSDLDGGFGREQTPMDLETIADLARLPEMLRARGYSEEDARGIAHGNFLRFAREALPE